MEQSRQDIALKRKKDPLDDVSDVADPDFANPDSCVTVAQPSCKKFRRENIEKGDVSKHSNDSMKKLHLNTHFLEKNVKPILWLEIRGENLFLQHTQLYSKEEASVLFKICEQELSYNVGDLAKVKLFGKWIDIPRKQVAHGEPGLTYTFSGNTVPARPWTPILTKIRDHIAAATGYSYNFVLINRYKDGHDYMGEHKDDEKDLVAGHPIASLTLGQPRDFVFKHQDCRGKQAKRKIDTITIQLNHGMLLLMNHPTNSYWYHSLPRRTRALGVRINMTFRKMEPSHCKPV